MSPGGVSKKTLLNPSKKLLLNVLSANGIYLLNLVGKAHKSQSQRLFSTRAKIRQAQNILTHREANQPRDKFSLS